MLQSVTLTNFKCFQQQSFSFTNLTVLSGLNGMGKSSLLQSLLLLRQSRDVLPSGLRLNGAYVNLGAARDVLCEDAEKDFLSISLAEDGGENTYQYDCSDSYSDFLPLIGLDTNCAIPTIFSDRFTYLSAYRIAPQAFYSIANEADLKRRSFGTNGEFAVQYLKIHKDDAISCDSLILGSPEENSLGLQVMAWMNQVSPGVSPIITINLQARTAELNYEFIQGTEKTMTYKSINVGFGITYVLPIIVTLLSARAGDLVFLENPEAHIHPKGQRYLGELIARAASGGVQIVLETHSDHILNGVRIAARTGILNASDVTLAYFSTDHEKNGDYKRRIFCPKLLQNGQIDQWPEGFFDEWDNSLLELL